MTPAIAAGERIVVDRTAYWFQDIARWQVVVFRCPGREQELCVKRVAGLPGERIQLRDGVVHADGRAEPAPAGLRYGVRRGREGGVSVVYELGPDEFFVLGDNSAASVDSRIWEPFAVPLSFLVGRAMIRHARDR